jgi:hypothetical protein
MFYGKYLPVPAIINTTRISSLNEISNRRLLVSDISNIQLEYTVTYEFPISSNLSDPRAFAQMFTYFGNLTTQLTERVLSGEFTIAREQFCNSDDCSANAATAVMKPIYLGPFLFKKSKTVSTKSVNFFSSKYFMYIVYILPFFVCICLILFCFFCLTGKRRRSEQSLEDWMDSESGDIRVHKIVRNGFLRFTPSKFGSTTHGLNLKDIYNSGDDVNAVNPAFRDSFDTGIESEYGVHYSGESSKRNSLRNFQSTLQELRDNMNKSSSSVSFNDTHVTTPDVYNSKESVEDSSRYQFFNPVYEESSSSPSPFSSPRSPLNSALSSPRPENPNSQNLRKYHTSLVARRDSIRNKEKLSQNSSDSNVSMLDLYGARNEYDLKDSPPKRQPDI